MLELGLWDTQAPSGLHGRAGGGGQKAPQASSGASLGMLGCLLFLGLCVRHKHVFEGQGVDFEASGEGGLSRGEGVAVQIDATETRDQPGWLEGWWLACKPVGSDDKSCHSHG